MAFPPRYHPYSSVFQEEDHHDQSYTPLAAPTTHSPPRSRPHRLPPSYLLRHGALPHVGHPSLDPSLQIHCIGPPHITDPRLRYEQNSVITESSAPHRTTGSQDYHVGHHGSASNIARSSRPADLNYYSRSFPVSNIRRVIPPRIRRKSDNKPDTDQPHAVTAERILVADTMVQLQGSIASQAPSNLSSPTSPSSQHPHIAVQLQGPDTDNSQDQSNPAPPPAEKEMPVAGDEAGLTEESGDPVTSFQVASDNRDSLLVPSFSSTPMASIARDRTSRLASLRKRPKPYERPDQTFLAPRARKLRSKRARRPTFAVEGAEPEETVANGVPLQSSQAPSNDHHPSGFPSSSAQSAPEFSGRVLRSASKRKSKPYDRLEAPNSRRRNAASRSMKVPAGSSTSTQSQLVDELDAEEQTRTDLLVRESSPSQLPSDDDDHLTSSNSSESASSEWVPESGPRRATAQTEATSRSRQNRGRSVANNESASRPRAPLPLKAKMTQKEKAEMEKNIVFIGMKVNAKYRVGDKNKEEDAIYQCRWSDGSKTCDALPSIKSVVTRHYKEGHLKVRILECEHFNTKDPKTRCTQTFRSMSQYKVHANSVHLKKLIYKCTGCEQAFFNPSVRSRHTASKHPGVLMQRNPDPYGMKQKR